MPPSTAVKRTCLALAIGQALSASIANADSFAPATEAELISAVTEANINSQADLIDLGGNVFTLTSSISADNGLPIIRTDGGNALTIWNGTIERAFGVSNFRLIQIEPNGTLNLVRVTIRGGNSNGAGGGINVSNTANLTITNSTISGNTTNTFGGGIYGGNNANLTITNTTISGNTANASIGGIGGGGLYNNLGNFNISNSTIAGNYSVSGGGGIRTRTNAGDFTSLSSTVIAGNSTDLTESDLSAANPIDLSNNNLIEDPNGANGVVDGVDGNIVGQGDPNLDVLDDNCGPTETHGVLSGSLVIDAGGSPPTLTEDQRGFSRTNGAQTDIGAFEFTENAAPDFTLLGDQTVNEGAGRQTVPAFLSNTNDWDPGVGQGLTLRVTNDNNSIFVEQPSIDLISGALTYRPADGASGIALVIVILMDDGGTAGDGDDTSLQVFIIEVVSEKIFGDGFEG